MTKEQKLRKLIREHVKNLLMESSFPHKEEFVMFEKLVNQQEQIYPDAADVGITPEHKDFKKIRPALVDMVKTFGSKNSKYSYGGRSGGGTVKMFIPIEEDYGQISGYVLEVSFWTDPKLKKLYRKTYDSFFSIDNLFRTNISKQKAKMEYGSKQFANEGMIKEEDRYWMGSINDVDDFGKPIKDVFIDGKTNQGPWGIMSPESFRIYGVGVGQGKGQKYKKQPDGKWKKIQG